MAPPVVPFKSEPTRWRWGILAMVGAVGTAAVTRAYYGGKAGMVVLLLLLFANGITGEVMLSVVSASKLAIVGIAFGADRPGYRGDQARPFEIAASRVARVSSDPNSLL